MNRIHFSTSHKIILTIRFIVIGSVLCALVLPAAAQALQGPDPTVTPEGTSTLAATPTATEFVPPAPATEFSSLTFPTDASQLASDRALALLAGKFIFHGLVDASSCADGGMLNSGAASACGESVAHNAVILWQNQFDADIFAAAQESGIPPFVLKNVFIKESQFWPQTYRNPIYGGEYGLGHITYLGADMLLSWNYPFYKKICNQNFNKETCATEYVFQDASTKEALRSVVLTSINADCASCLGGVDLENARNSVWVTAAMLVANRNHVEWLVNGFSSSNQLSLKNKWRFTLTSYNAGPGCFTNAFATTRGKGNVLSWKDVSERLDGACKAAIEYVDFVMETTDTADPSALLLASTDTSPAARMVLGPLQVIEPTALTPTATLAAPETTIVSSPTETPLPLTEPESPTPSPIAVAETATETSLPPTPTATETALPTSTATPMIQPTAFVPAADVETGEIVVKFGGLVPQFLANSAVSLAGGEIQTQVDSLGLTIVSAPQDQLQQVLADLQGNMLVDYAEADYPVQVFYAPNDPDYINQTNLADLQIPEAWDITKGEGIIVAIIDTGVDITHPDLATNVWVNPGEDGLDTNGNDKRSNYIDDDNDGYMDNWMGWNFVDNNNDARDGNGHGTQTAGIIAAQMDNALGISGIAPRARIMAIKALDNSGFGTYSQAAQAIIYAVDHGAKVINLGFGGTANSEALLAATNYAYDHNVIVVAAGGNTGAGTLIYPAANPKVIGVSALDENLNVAAFSSYSDAIQISAPGVGIYSTTPGGNYGSMSGTSMSAAQVSGIVALLATQPQFSTPDTVREALFNSAADLGSVGTDLYYGFGLAHAFDALRYGTVIPTATASAQSTASGPTATADANANGGVNAMAQEIFWGQSQSCSTLTNGANSLITPYSFDGNTAQCVNNFASGSGWLISDLWRPTNIPTTTYTSIYSATLGIDFYMTGLSTDTYEIQFSPDNGANWYKLEAFNAGNLPPVTLTHRSYNVGAVTSVITNAVDSAAEVNNFQVRMWATVGGTDTVSIDLDQVSLTAVQNTAPVVGISAPADNLTFTKNTAITFTGTVTDDHDATPALIWYSNMSGPIGTGTSVSLSSLMPGTHTITAQSTDSNGAVGSSSITVTITPSRGPHGNFSSSTDTCALCHRTHSAQGPAYLTSDPNSVTTSDAFCLTCHNGTLATAVSTHSNADWASAVEPAFEIRCIQCHDTHGSTNLFAIRTAIIPDLSSPTTIDPMIFTSLTGPNSFDDNASVDRLCVSCHTSVTNHAGGVNHLDGQSYAGQSCVACHPHNADSGITTRDGFMPVRTTNP